jgi:hypothetical protein
MNKQKSSGLYSLLEPVFDLATTQKSGKKQRESSSQRLGNLTTQKLGPTG